MKTISHDDYLKALGLFTLACEGADQATLFENAIGKLLGIDPPYYSGGHISDALYVGLGRKPVDFKELLRREGFEVEAATLKTEGPSEAQAYGIRECGDKHWHMSVFRTRSAAEGYINTFSAIDAYEIVPLFEMEPTNNE